MRLCHDMISMNEWMNFFLFFLIFFSYILLLDGQLMYVSDALSPPISRRSSTVNVYLRTRTYNTNINIRKKMIRWEIETKSREEGGQARWKKRQRRGGQWFTCTYSWLMFETTYSCQHITAESFNWRKYCYREKFTFLFPASTFASLCFMRVEKTERARE